VLWLKKKTTESEQTNDVVPVDLEIELDEKIVVAKLQQLLEGAAEKGSIEEFVNALQSKHELFAKALGQDELSQAGLESLMETIFPARRKLPAVLSTVPFSVIQQQLNNLLKGSDALEQRIAEFVAIVEDDNRKIKRAAWDFATEIVHFYDPERFPLMSKWVWDQRVQSGATREFIRANDTLPNIPAGESAGHYEAVRQQLMQFLTEQGFYRDLPFMVDLLLAQAYTDYVLAMSSGMGMMGSEFGGKMEPIEFIAKILGIDPARSGGKSRLKQSQLH
jgi:hypothetical protein